MNTNEVLKLALEALAVKFSEGWHEGIKIDASDIMLLNQATQALTEQPTLQEPAPCCGKYETCTQACTPRGRFLGKQEALAEPPAQQEYTSFAEWAHDYVQNNLHKLKPAQQEPAGWRPATFHRDNLSFNPGFPDEQTVKFWKLQGVEIEYCYTSPLLLSPGATLYTSPPAQQEPVPCCGKYETCIQACTPRGRFLGKQEALAEQPAQTVSHAIIAGALFDFMGWLTSRKERLVLSGADEASPAVDAISDFAKMRGLSLDDAKVQDWHTTPPAQRTWVGLTNKDIYDCEPKTDWYDSFEFAQAIKAKLKEKNT